jgi:aminoglycoside phosphotransferase (APT) family kinase protein
MSAIHRIDPEPVLSRARSSAPTAALTVEELTRHLHAVSEDIPLLHAAFERLRDTRPSHARDVVCHGDLHPFNLLTEPDGTITVLDWTGAAIASPAYDVALTWLLLRYPPLEAPAALRGAINTGAPVLARRFVRAYRTLNPGAALDDLEWHVGLHSARLLLDLTRWQRAGDERARAHPWHLVASGATRAVRRATGIDVSNA